mmetsp:Transcript_24601/g.38207  ORF Transcript_24601/g.38207 Transcript_24601/m.38207 type:complete len:99 (+) Transcript_24601:534-830(+)
MIELDEEVQEVIKPVITEALTLIDKLQGKGRDDEADESGDIFPEEFKIENPDPIMDISPIPKTGQQTHNPATAAAIEELESKLKSFEQENDELREKLD